VIGVFTARLRYYKFLSTAVIDCLTLTQNSRKSGIIPAFFHSKRAKKTIFGGFLSKKLHFLRVFEA
jgi:hypothetical protein